MTLNGWIQIVALLRDRRRAGEAARLVHDARLQRRAHVPVAGPAAGRGRPLSRSAASTRPASSTGSTYTVAMLLFHVGGFLILYALLRLQGVLPFNPQGMAAVPEYLTFNTAVSFITNTNWQNYGGESTLSYLVQMLGLTHQNFLSAATGIVLAVALIRGFARASVKTVGNFWVDITRCTLYILHSDLHPLCACSWSGRACRRRSAPMSMRRRWKAPSRPSPSARSPRRSPSRCSAPMAAASSTPTPRIPSRTRRRCRIFVQMVSIFAIGAALTNVFGRMVGNQRQGWAILAAMGVLFIAGVVVCYWAEAAAIRT